MIIKERASKNLLNILLMTSSSSGVFLNDDIWNTVI
jgi:hypothetical protein